ncbi:MAG: glycosyltransferase [Acidobacteria bacterium]|nr:glycosyltransferase [Acidobacteriota bacterium]MBM3815273.1 glycosyltransferase [Acidimicrobiia bacterium]
MVSDGGDEDLAPVAAPFRDALRLRLAEAGGAGPAGARNRGLAVARGEIALFTDDDCRPQSGWVAALAAGVSGKPPVAAGGATFNGLPEDPYADAAQLILLLLSRHDRAAVGHERLLASNNLAFPLAELRAMGGFDERLRTAEDREICRRWLAAGFELTRVAGAVVEHDERMNLAGFARKFFQYGRGAAQFHGSAVRPGASFL